MRIVSKNRIDNLLNEYKGVLFEYLFAKLLAKHYGREENFLLTMNAKLLELLERYERALREENIELLKALPLLANFAFNHFIASGIIPPLDIASIHLVGRKLGRDSLPNIESRYLALEADLLLTKSNGEIIPISTKLCKKASFVNTKNGGVKSFVSKYLGDESQQSKLSERLDYSYYKMVAELYDQAEIPGDPPLDGSFDERWSAKGLSDLPGELPQELQRLIHQYYAEVIFCLYEMVVKVHALDAEKFTKMLYPLCGLSADDLIQVITYHDGEHLPSSVRVLSKEHLQRSLRKVEILPYRSGTASFEIRSCDFSLQLRVKPMNRFTTKTPKINCSVRLHDPIPLL
ncbi:MAG: hypothetical protein HQK50_05300 [Oligoflexia bacterium]|nr:hypothetical protein [Oligoflexia bacterium]MBF0364965.1 hypothetical protein [Oligoflexia bacterium]